jgi:ABC-type nitrate/sulfonate/bicarbonate transport system substrate-binding protein
MRIMVHVRRVSFIAAAAAAALVLGLTPIASTVAADLPVVRIAKASAVGISFMPLEIGEAAGIWQRAGIKLEVSALRGDGQVQQALTTGDIDMGLGSGPGLGFVAKGVPAVAVGALSGAPNSMGIVMGMKSTVKTVADLKGKRIGITTAGSLTDWLVRQLAIQQGWNQTAISTVALGDTKAQAAALATGEIDGICGASEFGYDLQDHNQGRMLVTFGSIVPQFLTQVIYARNDFVAQHPDLVQKFLLGWYRSVIYMKAHRAQSLALAAKIGGTDEHAVGQTFDATMPVMSTDGRFEPLALERLGKSFVDLGILSAVPDMNSLITRRFVPVKT